MEFHENSEAKNIFMWIRYIVFKYHPISCTNDPITLDLVKMQAVDPRTVKKWIMRLSMALSCLIKHRIGPGFMMGDGWANAGIHYFALLHRWPWHNSKDNKVHDMEALIAFAPFLDETSQTAKAQADYIKGLYEVTYGLNVKEDIRTATFDNTNVNPASVTLLSANIKFIGAYCHRMNLACRSEMKLSDDMSRICDRAHAQMKLVGRSANNLGKCREVDMNFGVAKRNDTRWVSEYAMMRACLKAQPYLRKTDIFEEDEEIIVAKDKKGEVLRRSTAELFNPRETKKAEELLTKLKRMAMYMKEIQAEDGNLLTCNNIFTRAREDDVIDGSEQEWKARLSDDHKLCKEKFFERACIKIIAGPRFERMLTVEEREAAQCLLKSSFTQAYPNYVNEKELDMQQLLRQNPNELQQVQRNKDIPLSESDYVNVSQVYPITAGMERVFSKAKMMIPAHRKRMQPILLEALMMLLVNKKWWDLQFFTEVYQQVWDKDMAENGYDLDIDEKLCDDDDLFIDMDVLNVLEGEADYDEAMNEAHGDDPEEVEREVMNDFIAGLNE
jgi:hypothetical protein